MASKFREFFGGSGNLNGKAPDIGLSGGLVWGGGSGLTRSANRVTSTNNADTNDSGSADYGNTVGTTYVGAPTSGTASFQFTTGPSVGANAAGHRGFTVYLNFGTNGNSLAVDASGNTAGAWTLSFNGSSAAITVAPNTTYTGELAFASGTSSITMFGQTFGDANVTSTAGGLNYIWLVVGSTTSLGALDIYDAGGPSSGTGSLTADVSTPMLALGAYFGGGADIATPMLTLSAALIGGNSALLTLPMLTLDAAAHDSTGENAVDYVIPMLTLQADFGATVNAILPMLVLDAQGTGTAFLTAELTLPMITLDAAGTGSPWSITADITLPILTLGAHFGGGAAVSLPMLTVDISATAGGILSAEITLPLLTADIQVTLQNYGWADITLPMIQPAGSMTFNVVLPMLTLDAVVSAIVTATYEAYAINLNHVPKRGVEPVDEMTRYTNFPFTQVVRYKNSYYGVGADGNLYLLEGTADVATPIPWAFKTAMTDFDSPTKKTIASGYFSGRFGPASALALYSGEDGGTVYSYSTPRDALAQNHRQKFGKGLKERYHALGASGTGALELDKIELDVHNMTRRI